MGIKGAFSGWLPVTSGVPRDSVLGLLHFTVFVSDLDNGADGFVAKSVDDTKLGGVVGRAEEAM